MKRTTGNVTRTRVGGFDLRVHPTVFHPKYFGSSAILGGYIESLDLEGKSFLDMGAGSGIVGLFAARAGARVTGVDVNPAAVLCATENASAAGFNIEYHCGDLFTTLPGRRFDVIAWNPPFFPRSADSLAEAAFYAGENYDAIARFAVESRMHLNPSGLIYVVLSMDLEIPRLTSTFDRERFVVRQVATRKWGFGETMIVFEMR
jgi:release factor glutamine methyltransferase